MPQGHPGRTILCHQGAHVDAELPSSAQSMARSRPAPHAPHAVLLHAVLGRWQRRLLLLHQHPRLQRAPQKNGHSLCPAVDARLAAAYHP